MGDVLGFLFLMTPVFYAVFFVGVPVAAAWWAWRRWRTPVARTASALGGVVLFGALAWFAQHEKWDADRQVRELCAKDGGVKVYEQVRLPVERFDKYGQINFYKPTQRENALGPDYVLETDIRYLQKGSPSLRRYHVRVIRKSDGVLLGESVGYNRGGGDLPGPWQPSSFSCPQEYGEVVIHKVFVTEGMQQ